MNQILSIGPENNRDNRPKGPVSDKVVRVFAILLVVFAVILIGSGVYSLLQNRENSNGVKIPTVASKVATINAIEDTVNAKVILTIESEIAINKVSYSWNASTDKTIDGNKQLALEKEIDLPSGENTLTVKVVDIENNETKKSFEFNSENENDITSPNITLVVTEEKKLQITAIDETQMSHITYRWNDDEEVEVRMEEDAEDKTTLEVLLDIPRGKNTITVVAVDASKKHNSRTKTDTLTGVTKPVIPKPTVTADGVLTITCTHEVAIKQIYYTLNDVPYAIDLEKEPGYPDNFKEVSFDIKVPTDQDSRIILSVTSIENTVTTEDYLLPFGTPSGDEEDNTNTNTSEDENSNSSNNSNNTNNTGRNTTEE